MSVQVTYQDPAFRFSGFWQENEAGELVSYKRVAGFELGFSGARLKLLARLDTAATWLLDGREVQPESCEAGLLFSCKSGSHCLKGILVSTARIRLRGAEADGFFTTPEKPYIHFIGDSITHNYPGFASASAGMLGVDHSVTAHCGMSLVDGWGWYPLAHGLAERVGMESNYFQLETPDETSDFTPYRFEYCRKPDAIVMYLGVNDYLTEGGNFKEENPYIFAERYTAFVRKLRQQYPGVPVFILQCHLPDRTIRIGAIADAYKAMRQTMDDVYLLNTHRWNVSVSADKVHPSAEGYAQMAENVSAVLRDFLEGRM